MIYDLIVIGGGAAGIFAAINAKTALQNANVLLLEKSGVLLAKVRVSGGGRCNVTHSCFDPQALAKHYPRGEKELVGPYHRFQPRDTMHWFESRGVALKTEEDGRIFPTSNNSETIIQCLLAEAKTLGVEILLKQRIQHISNQDQVFKVELQAGDSYQSKHLLLATGSSSEGHVWAEQLGHQIQKPVPSLFTFNVPTSPLLELSGIAINPVELRIEGTSLLQKGPLLLTHFGFSGPAALKLSAWGARHLHEKNYQTGLILNWLPEISLEEIFHNLTHLKSNAPQKNLAAENPFRLPKNLWKALSGIESQKKLSTVTHKELRRLAEKLHADPYRIEGKTTHKEEFVTCGGVTLKEIDFKTMQSKICPGLFFAGEVLDIDGITGGFNFQNAWTTGFIAGNAAVTDLSSRSTLSAR